MGTAIDFAAKLVVNHQRNEKRRTNYWKVLYTENNHLWTNQRKSAGLSSLRSPASKPSQYKRLLNLAKGKVILFLAAITLITTILGYGMDVAGFTVSVGGWKNFYFKQTACIWIKRWNIICWSGDGLLRSAVYNFVADTSKDKVSTEDLSNKYQMELVFAKNEMVVKNTAVGNMWILFHLRIWRMLNSIIRQCYLWCRWSVVFIVIMFFTQWIANIISYLTVCTFYYNAHIF